MGFQPIIIPIPKIFILILIPCIAFNFNIILKAILFQIGFRQIADIGKTVVDWFGVENSLAGESFADAIFGTGAGT